MIGAEGRASREQVVRLERRLTERDRLVLASLHNHRFLTTDQLQRFHFTQHDSTTTAARVCRRTLTRLAQLQLIEHLERRVGGVRAGSASYVWRTGLLGDRLLRLHEPTRARARRKEPSLRWLAHCLAVADVHLALLAIAEAPDDELLQLATEPDCWRSYLQPGGSPDILKPDLYAVTASGDYEDHWFIEVDRATESLPTLLRKCTQYQSYYRSGTEQREHGLFPRVVWVVPDDLHAAKLQQAITETRDLQDDLFRVCTLNSLPAVIGEGAA